MNRPAGGEENTSPERGDSPAEQLERIKQNIEAFTDSERLTNGRLVVHEINYGQVATLHPDRYNALQESGVGVVTSDNRLVQDLRFSASDITFFLRGDGQASNNFPALIAFSRLLESEKEHLPHRRYRILFPELANATEQMEYNFRDYDTYVKARGAGCSDAEILKDEMLSQGKLENARAYDRLFWIDDQLPTDETVQERCVSFLEAMISGGGLMPPRAPMHTEALRLAFNLHGLLVSQHDEALWPLYAGGKRSAYNARHVLER